jgi:hypothetical protein
MLLLLLLLCLARCRRQGSWTSAVASLELDFGTMFYISFFLSRAAWLELELLGSRCEIRLLTVKGQTAWIVGLHENIRCITVVTYVLQEIIFCQRSTPLGWQGREV